MNTFKKSLAAGLWYSGVGPLVSYFSRPQKLILAYHSIYSSAPTPKYRHISLSVEDFKRQLEFVRSLGYKFVRFRDLTNTPRKAVAVYFDDGFRDVAQNVYPILKKENIPGTIFITTDYIDQKKDANAYLTWSEVESLSNFFEIESHGVSHRKLNKISLEDAEWEMRESRRIIIEKLGRDVVSFSFPYGRSSQRLIDIAKDTGYLFTTADSEFYKVRPDPDDTTTIFKLKIGVPWL